MIRALIAVIFALVITAVCLWAWGLHNSDNAVELARSLENQKNISSDLRASLTASQKTNKDLTEQLQYERQLLQDLQTDSQGLTNDFIGTQDQLRILRREDKEYSDWANTALPISVVGVLAKPTRTASHSDKD